MILPETMEDIVEGNGGCELAIDILALKNTNCKFQVTYDSNNKRVFTIQQLETKDLHFDMHKDILKYHNTSNYHATLVQNVIENGTGYIQCNIKDAK